MTAATTSTPRRPVGGRPGVRLRRGLATVLDGVFVSRVRDGRLRRVDWPAGWGAIVVLGYVALGVAGVLALTAAAWRRGTLVVVTDTNTLPQAAVWLLLLLLTVVAAMFHTAATHAPWWVRALSLVVIVVLLVVWVAGTSAGAGWWAVPGLLCALALVALTLVWGRAEPRWWEFASYFGLIGLPLAVGMLSVGVHQYPLGFDVVPAMLTQMVATFALLAAPAAVASGTAVAEITVAATTWVARVAGRLSRRRTLLIALVVVCALRAAQCVHHLRGTDRLDWTWAAWVPILGVLVALAAVSVAILRRIGRPDHVTELPEEVAGLGMPLGAGLLGILVPFSLGLYVLGIAMVLAGGGSGWFASLSSMITGDWPYAVTRGAAAAGLLLFAFCSVRARARPALALLAGHIAVFLIPAPLVLTAIPFSLTPDPDRLNLTATAGAFVLIVVCLVRRRLTSRRIATLGALVVLGGVFSGRETLLDPLTAVFGQTAPVILLGLVWSVLADCAWANTEGRRFRACVRSLFAVGNILLAAVVLAYYALAGSPSMGGLDTAAELGDRVLGTALLTAAFVVLLVDLRWERTAEPVHTGGSQHPQPRDVAQSVG